MKSTENQEVPVTELAMSLSYQFEALIRVLEAKGILSRDELLEEIRATILKQDSNQFPSQAH